MKLFSVSLLFTAFLLAPPLYSQAPGDTRFTAGGVVSTHERNGFIDFGNDNIEQKGKNTLHTFGLFYGKNFRLPAGLRLNVPFFFEYGLVKEETIENLQISLKESSQSVITDLDLYSVVYYGGIRPMVQLPIRLTATSWFYSGIGAAVLYTSFSEECRKDDLPINGEKTDVRMTGSDFFYLENSNRFSFGASAGAGFETIVMRKYLVSFQYLFLFWNPVNYKTAHDLFPLEAKPYHERFFSHSIALGVLFSPPGSK